MLTEPPLFVPVSSRSSRPLLPGGILLLMLPPRRDRPSKRTEPPRGSTNSVDPPKLERNSTVTVVLVSVPWLKSSLVLAPTPPITMCAGTSQYPRKDLEPQPVNSSLSAPPAAAGAPEYPGHGG
jgi:hypothetical protein